MKDEFAEINVVPLVDIMLVLIVIVLVTANFMVQGMLPIQPPKSESRGTPVDESLIIAITADGELYYEKRAVSQDELSGLLSTADKERPVLISADKDLTLQPFVSLVDTVKRLGFTTITVQTSR